MSMFTQYTLAFLKKPNDILRGKPKKWRLAFENNNKDLKTETTIQLRVPVCGEYYLFFFGEIEKCLKLDLFPSHSQEARVGGFFPFKSFCKASPIVPGFSGDAIEAESEKLSKSVSFDFL